MTSLKKIRANHLNARASTGPKSVRGRVRAAQNARQHGLSVSLTSDPALSHQVRLLAHEISGECEAIDERSIRVAEAQIDLVRVRLAKQAVLEQLNEIWAETREARSANSEEQLSDTDRLMKQLLRIDRYERRALSRRRKAIRSLGFERDEITWRVIDNLAERSQNSQ
jgi:hypothetical protein